MRNVLGKHPLLISLVTVSLMANIVFLVRRALSAVANTEGATALLPVKQALQKKQRDRKTPGATGPITLDQCEMAIAAREEALVALNENIARHLPLAERFRLSPLNDELASDVRARLQERVGANIAAFKVECRGETCQIDGLPGNDVPDARAWLRGRARETQGKKESQLVHVLPRDVVSGADLLKDLLRDYKASGIQEKCRALAPKTGVLEVALTIAEGSQQSPSKGVEITSGGALAGTQMGACLLAELQKRVEAEPVPVKVSAATIISRIGLAGEKR
jgi:hypothetical protein